MRKPLTRALPVSAFHARAFAALTLAGAAIALLGGKAKADPLEDFYKSKEVSIYIGSTPGGGFDLYGRLVSRHMSRHMPGAPNMVVKNMPGAGGIAQVNYLLGPAARDGTQIGIINPVMTTAPFLTPNVAKWDFARLRLARIGERRGLDLRVLAAVEGQRRRGSCRQIA